MNPAISKSICKPACTMRHVTVGGWPRAAQGDASIAAAPAQRKNRARNLWARRLSLRLCTLTLHAIMSNFAALPRPLPLRSNSPMRRVAAFVALAFITLNAWAEPICSRALPIHATCEIALDALHPTQPAIGMIPVEERAARMNRNVDGAAYTSKRPLPVVQAPDGTFYLTDGHHLVSVLQRVGAKKITAQIIGRFDNPATFWNEMQARHWVYLFDPKGNSISPAALPAHIADLADDPYRSLATYAEDAGYYKKTDAYFMEFQWAHYFGERMGWQPIDRLNLLSALQTAEKLACQPQAKDLPGYAGPCRAAP